MRAGICGYYLSEDDEAAVILSLLEWSDSKKDRVNGSIFEDIDSQDNEQDQDEGIALAGDSKHHVLDRLGALQLELNQIEGKEMEEEVLSREDHILYPFPKNVAVERDEGALSSFVESDFIEDGAQHGLIVGPEQPRDVDPSSTCSLHMTGVSFSLSWSMLQQWNEEAKNADKISLELEQEEERENERQRER